jgi:hypothetical protein
MMDSVISWKQWEETYKPINDTMFDFVDEVIEVSKSPHHIWTVVDNNPNSVYLDVIPGYRLFNRLGFYVTEIPWEDKDMVVSNDKSYYL